MAYSYMESQQFVESNRAVLQQLCGALRGSRPNSAERGEAGCAELQDARSPFISLISTLGGKAHKGNQSKK